MSEFDEEAKANLEANRHPLSRCEEQMRENWWGEAYRQFKRTPTEELINEYIQCCVLNEFYFDSSDLDDEGLMGAELSRRENVDWQEIDRKITEGITEFEKHNHENSDENKISFGEDGG